MLGTVPPNNTMVAVNGSFNLQCMPHDYWMTHGSYWYIYFTVTSIICRLYAAASKGAKSKFNCTKPYDMKRFKAYRQDYVLQLDVGSVTAIDAGLYVCAQPPRYRQTMGELGLIAVVGVVCELSLF